jgi:hypothetical protein
LTVLENSNTQNAFLFPVHTKFRHDCPLAVIIASTPLRLIHKQIWRDSVPIDMFLSAVSVLVVAQPNSEFPEGLMNYPVYMCLIRCLEKFKFSDCRLRHVCLFFHPSVRMEQLGSY